MKPIVAATLLSLCVALLCLAQSLSQLAQEHNLPDPAITCMSESVTFNHFVCCGCYDRGPGSRTNSYFCSYKAVTTHIGRSVVCQNEGKGVRTVTMQYRPSGRAEDHEAGPVGAPGAWPVRPAANAAPGKQYRTSHRRSRYCMRHRTVSAYVFVDIGMRYRIMATLYTIWPCDIV